MKEYITEEDNYMHVMQNCWSRTTSSPHCYRFRNALESNGGGPNNSESEEEGTKGNFIDPDASTVFQFFKSTALTLPCLQKIADEAEH